MAFVYDLETEIRFQQGSERGIEKGIKDLLLSGIFTVEYIAEIYEMPVSRIKRIQERLKK
jgi:hypothetical protein